MGADPVLREQPATNPFNAAAIDRNELPCWRRPRICASAACSLGSASTCLISDLLSLRAFVLHRVARALADGFPLWLTAVMMLIASLPAATGDTPRRWNRSSLAMMTAWTCPDPTSASKLHAGPV